MKNNEETTVPIHPTAVIHPKAVIGEGTSIGAFSFVGESVVIGKNCDIQEHVILKGNTTLGDESRVFPHAVVGGEPQHLGYKNEPTQLVIGNRVTLRECVTVHRGTGEAAGGHGITRIGDDSFIMAYSHVAHDCVVGNNVILANCVQMAGHSEVQDYAVVGGNTGIVQFCRVGRYAYIGGGSMIRKDLLPFMAGKGNVFEVQGINVVGLTRRGFNAATLGRLKQLYKIIFHQHLTFDRAVQKMSQEFPDCDETKVFCDFIQTSKAGLIR